MISASFALVLALNSAHKLSNRAVELENGYSLLQMENEIVGEKLKGMHLAIQSIATRKFLEEKLMEELVHMSTDLYSLGKLQAETASSLTLCTTEKDRAHEDALAMMANYHEVRADRDKIAGQAKDRIVALKNELDHSIEELERLRGDFSKLEKKYKDMGEEHDKLRQKLKVIRMKRKQYGEGEEMLCRKCQKTYLDSENFNWSCRTHTSEYSENMWWCCGRGKDAPGCQVSKHESKEDEDNEPRDQEENERRLVSSIRCSVSDR